MFPGDFTAIIGRTSPPFFLSHSIVAECWNSIPISTPIYMDQWARTNVGCGIIDGRMVSIININNDYIETWS